MKNYTLRSLYLTLAVVLFSAGSGTVQAQGTNCATFTTAGTPATLTPTSSWQTVTTQSNRYYTFNATAGCTYTFSHCQGGGSIPAGTDPALTITDASNNFFFYNDDGGTGCVTGASHIVWTCPTTGTYRIHHEKCCCTQAGASNFATMAYKVECPCDPGVASASPTVLCAGGNTTLSLSGNSTGSTLQWQVSTDNVNFTNIVNGITSPYTYGPLVADTFYFRSIVTCTGVNNTVGNDTTLSVMVVARPLPTIVFPGASGTLCCNGAPINLGATPVGGTYSGIGVINGTQFDPGIVCNSSSTLTYAYTDIYGCSNSATQSFTVNDTPAVSFPTITTEYCLSSCAGVTLNIATPAGGTYDDFGGTYISGTNTFIPCNTLTPGDHPLSYTYAQNGCSSTATQTIHTNPNPAITGFVDPADMCVGSAGIQLAANPGGGTFSDNLGNVNGSGFFTPTTSGTSTVTYSYTDQTTGCTANQSINIFVAAYPIINFQNPYPTLCENDAPVTLNGTALPLGGTYSGLGVFANQLNPANLCAQSPFYIRYTASNTTGCTSIDSQIASVNCIPSVSFTGPVPPVCAGAAPFSLTSYVTPAGGTFSCGGCTYLGGNTFNPTTPVNQNVTYTVSNGQCTNSVSFQVTVNALPNNVNVLPSEMCLNEPPMLLTPYGFPSNPPGVFSGAGVITQGGNYYWDPATGADTFTLYYTYTNTGGCSAMDSASLIVHDVNINFPPIADVCEDDALIQLQAAPAGGIFSSPTPGAVIGFGGNYYFDPTIGPGTYQIRYIYNDMSVSCSDTAYQNVIVKPRPSNITISNIVNPTTCGAANGSFRINGMSPNTNYVLTYLKNGQAQGVFSIVSSPLGTYTVTGLNAGNYSMITISLNGCSQLDPSTAFAVLTDPNAPAAPTAGANTPLCEFSTLQLTATSGVVNGSYNWTGPNSFFSNQQNPSVINISTLASGTYNVTVTDNLNCTSLPGTVNVVVNPAPNLSVSSNSPVCAGDTIELEAGSTTTGTNFQWQGPSGFSSITEDPMIMNASPSNAGWYYVTAIGANSCTRLDSVQVAVGTVTPITPIAGSNSPVCSGGTLNLTATNSTTGATYLWTGPVGYTSNVQNPVRPNITMADSGDYTVVASLVGCLSAPSTVHVSVIQSLTPNITITANPDDTVCFGTNIDFTSVISDGGTAPQYQWYKNGIPVIGAIDSFWGSPYLTNLDTVYAVLTNGTTCTTQSADTSNKIAIHMSPNTIPTVQVSSYPFAYVAGQNMTFTAYVLNAGTNPTFQWYLNGTILPGETNMSYSSNTLLSTDTLSVLVTSNAPCAIPDTATDKWNAVMNLSVTVGGAVVEDMKLFPNPNSGSFALSGTFKGMQGVKDATIEVVNAVGQVVYRENGVVTNGKLEKQVRISDIAAGVYVVRVSADGQTTQLKFIVNK
jgi:hypothetical protein